MGLGSNRHLLNAITRDDTWLKRDKGPSEFLNIKNMLIDQNDKETVTRNFPTWKDSHQHPTILYTDTSSKKTKPSGWVLD